MGWQIDLHANHDHLRFWVGEHRMSVVNRILHRMMLWPGRQGCRCNSISWRGSQSPRVRKGSVGNLDGCPYFGLDEQLLRKERQHLCTYSAGREKSGDFVSFSFAQEGGVTGSTK